MDLIYSDSNLNDIGIISDYTFDLAFGKSENDFSCTLPIQQHCCRAGYYLYMQDTEYGGIIDAVESNNSLEQVTYSGRTWHGMLDSHVICPDTGADYYNVSGEANGVIANLINRMGVGDLFTASSVDSGITVPQYGIRYLTGYQGILKVLSKANAKLKMVFDGYHVVLSAVGASDHTNDIDSDMLDIIAKKVTNMTNHILCLGEGRLKDRLVRNLYCDADGNISQTQTFFGLQEITAIYNYSSIDDPEELVKNGTERLKELRKLDECSADINDTGVDIDVGDTIVATDNVTGTTVEVEIKKKIISISNGITTISVSADAYTTYDEIID